MEYVMIKTTQEALYKAFLFFRERMAEYMRMGTRMSPEDLHEVMTVLFELQEASLALQPGENVLPPAPEASKPA
jgi:hypothetical protein